MAEQVTTTSSLVQELTARHQEPAWLAKWRENAFDAFQSLPEPWFEKTDLSKRPFQIGQLVETGQPLADAEAFAAAHPDSPIVFVADGAPAKVQLPVELAEKGVIFTDIHTALRDHEALVKAHLGSVVPADEGKWTALNQALFNGGAFLYVPKGVQIETPFLLVYSESEVQQGVFRRSLVVGAERSQFAFAEVHFTAAEQPAGFTHSTVLEVVAMADSHITLAAVDQFVKGPTNFVTRRAHVGKDAVVNWIVGDIGDGFTVELVESRLEGVGANSSTRVLGLGHGRQHLDLTASMVHVGRNTESDIVMHGLLRDRANTVYRSSTQIVKGAVGAGSEQSDRMIVIDKTARADAIPMLLIDENDVKRCGHAASVGKIDPNQVYYLMSRGIPQSVAQLMIIWGYLRETVESLPGERVREIVEARIERELVR